MISKERRVPLQGARARLPYALLLLAAPNPALGQAPGLPGQNVGGDLQGSNPIELSLADAVRLAQQSSGVARAKRNTEIADIQVKNSKAGYYPEMNVSISANQSATGSSYRADDFVYRQGLIGNFLGGASVQADVPIDISGITARQVRQARIGAEISNLQLAQARDDAGANAAIAYLTALKARNAADIDAKGIASIEDLLARAKTTSPGVVPFLTLELATARQAAGNSAAAAAVGEDALKQALSLPTEAEIALSSKLAAPDPDPELTGGNEVENRGDIKTAKRAVDQADIAIVQADDGRRPTISAGVYYNQFFGGKFVSDTGATRNRDYGVNLSVRLPILSYDAGRGDRGRRIAELRAEQARADLDDRRRAAEVKVRQARSAYERSRKRLDQLPDAEAALAALKLAETSLLSASPADAPALLAQLSNARQAWRSAATATADAYAESAIAVIRLRRIQGLAIAGEISAPS